MRYANVSSYVSPVWLSGQSSRKFIGVMSFGARSAELEVGTNIANEPRERHLERVDGESSFKEV